MKKKKNMNKEGRVTLESLATRMESGFATMNSRFSTMEGKFSIMEGKFSTMEGKFSTMEGKFSTMEGKFSTMETTIERGFAAVADDISKLATKEEMATGFLRIEERLYSIEQELKDIKRRLTVLEDEFGSINKRYKQEIEELWKHVAAIEKHLKMQR